MPTLASLTTNAMILLLTAALAFAIFGSARAHREDPERADRLGRLWPVNGQRRRKSSSPSSVQATRALKMVAGLIDP